MLGIIGAMDSEVNELKECMKNPQIENISGIDFYWGEIENKKIVLAKSGVGKVFAAVCADRLLGLRPSEEEGRKRAEKIIEFWRKTEETKLSELSFIISSEFVTGFPK